MRTTAEYHINNKAPSFLTAGGAAGTRLVMKVGPLLPLMLCLACRSGASEVPAGPGTVPVGGQVQAASGLGESRGLAPSDPHSYSEPERVRVRHADLGFEVDFDRRVIHGQATWRLDRRDPGAPLRLDTRGLTIHAVEIADLPADGTDLPPKTGAATSWRSAVWKLGAPDPILGAALEVALDRETTAVRVHYDTAPEASGLQWLENGQTGDGKYPFLYSQSQAIHARSWVPCQDSPGVRVTYNASVTVPAPLTGLMAADLVGTTDGRKRTYAYQITQPIPSYLIALAVGRLDFADLGSRSGVWAEPGMLAKAKYEFADVERMMSAVEQLYGPYRWGRYDLLVLPPAFPLCGKENPKLTFATPTIIAGDRSLVALVAHELAHSWSGNLATNATWEGLWLNEGFTVYIERRIVEALYGRSRAEIEAVLGRQDLDEALEELPDEDERLRIDLTGRDPDDGLSDVAYEKGALLLRALEEAYGREVFDPFLNQWFDEHAFESVTTDEFVSYATNKLLNGAKPLPGHRAVDLTAWIDGPGVPDGGPQPSAAALDVVEQSVEDFASGKIAAKGLVVSEWTPQHWLHFLRKLSARVDRGKLAALDRRFGLTKSTNQEILAQWLEVCIVHGYRQSDRSLEAFLATIGRRKFLLPLYRALVAVGRRDDAMRYYAQSRAAYHPITQVSLDHMLGAG